jgi:hypothetical protein
MHFDAILLMGLLSLAVITVIGAVPAAHAVTTIIEDSASCSAVVGTWDPITSTCTLSVAYTLTSGNYIEVPSGTTLAITGTSSGLWVYGTVFNYGAIDISTSGLNSYGIYIYPLGTISNYGTIDVANSGGNGIYNGGTITDVDCGTITFTDGGTFYGNAVQQSGSCAPTAGVPEFPVLGLGSLLITALLLPALLVIARRFGKPSIR